MINRKFVPVSVVVASVAVAALVIAVAACGGGTTTTTTSAPATTSTSAAGGTTGSSTAPNEVLELYAHQMMAVFQDMATLPQTTDLSKITDVKSITDAEVQSATAFVDGVHSTYDKLKAIMTPPQFVIQQQQLVGLFGTWVDALDKVMAAVKNQDQAAFSEAQSAAAAAGKGLQTLFMQLGTQLEGGSTPSS